MRISDWSSDVCSSDLERQRAQVRERAVAGAEIVEREADALVLEAADDRLREREIVEQRTFGDLDLEPRGRIAGLGEDRQSVVWGKSVSVRVGLGGRSILKKTKRCENTQRSNIY